ncbi:sigma-54-dependent transcriptional regulator [Acidihalobacter prosperus]
MQAALVPRPQVLVVDDEPRSVETIARVLDEEFDVLPANDAEQAMQVMETQPVQVVLADQRMPQTTGIELLMRLREQWPEAVRIIISGFTDAADIIAGVNEAGIYHYVTKPWHPDALLLTVRNAARLHSLQHENARLAQELRLSSDDLARQAAARRGELRRRFRFEEIVRGDGSPLNLAIEQVERMAPYDVSVLITGESGTGKELFARALHYNSHRAESPFVVENCGAIPNELLESELFGHTRGAYTGAVADRAGLFEEADGGTLFLDEIGEISPEFQVKLLRVLQSGEFRPVGSNRQRHTDVRIVAATNRDLEQEVRAGRFRADLYYRIAEMSLHLPPLRERPMDIEPLVTHLVDRQSGALGKTERHAVDPHTIACLREYPWPGNVRELNNVLKQMLVLCTDVRLGTELLPPRVLQGTPCGDFAEPALTDDFQGGTLKERVENLEAAILRETLLRHRWNKSRAAEELGLSRVGLRSKLDRYGLDRKLVS